MALRVGSKVKFKIGKGLILGKVVVYDEDVVTVEYMNKAGETIQKTRLASKVEAA